MKYKTKAIPQNQSGWAITFADLMGLLVCFFVMLTVLLAQDQERLMNVSASFRKAFKSDLKTEVVVLVPKTAQEKDKRVEELLRKTLKNEGVTIEKTGNSLKINLE